MLVSSLFHIYRQTVKQITLTSTGFGGIYGLGIYNNKNSKKTVAETVGKYAIIGTLCGIGYPISISIYTSQIVKECIRNPHYPSTDAPIL
jgi:hypothetical protein